MAAACPGPAPPSADPDATGSGPPSWIILDDEAYIEDCDNATTAKGETGSASGSGLRVKVSFVAADPPRLSRFCIHGPRLNESHLKGRPSIHQAVDNLALISIAYGWDSTDYFFYRAAGRGRRPSIQPLPEIDSYLKEVNLLISVGFLPCGGDGGFAVAAIGVPLPPEGSQLGDGRELHVFRSERGTWTKSVLHHGRHQLCKAEKVIAMGDGKLGFVHLLRGILVCDVLSENPTGRFVPLPKLLPNNQKDLPDGGNEFYHARPFRDVAVYADGLIKCVEVEPLSRLTTHQVPRVTKRRVIPEKLPDDVSNSDELNDADLIPDPVDVEEVEMEEQVTYHYLGWRLIVWSRTPSSTCWRKECLIHVDDIAAPNPTQAASLAKFGGSRAPNLTLKDLRISFPSLSIDDSDALYLTSKVKSSRDNKEICVIKVDMRKKTLEEISPFLEERDRYGRLNYISCALSKYLNTESDGSQIGVQNDDSFSDSSALQESYDVISVSNNIPTYCVTPTSDYRPPTQYYGGYCAPLPHLPLVVAPPLLCHRRPHLPPTTLPCFGNNYHLPSPLSSPPPPPPPLRPLWQQPPLSVIKRMYKAYFDK